MELFAYLFSRIETGDFVNGEQEQKLYVIFFRESVVALPRIINMIINSLPRKSETIISIGERYRSSV